MSDLRIEPTGATLGAIVTGIDLANLDPAEWAEIEPAFHEYAVLIFPGQHLTDVAQTTFGARFGELAIDFLPFSNQRADGSLRDPDDSLMKLLKGNEGWHTDSSFMSLSAKASILSARKVPRSGGETEWADMRAAYDALDSETAPGSRSSTHTTLSTTRSCSSAKRRRRPRTALQSSARRATHHAARRIRAQPTPCNPRTRRCGLSSRSTPSRGDPRCTSDGTLTGSPDSSLASPRRSSTTSSTLRADRPASTSTVGSRGTSSSGTTAACSTGHCRGTPPSPA